MFIRIDQMALRMVIKLLVIPLIVGIGYELIKIAGRSNNWLTRIISAPGKWFQLITTKEPDEQQLSVALCALKGVLNEYPLNKEFIVDEEGNYLYDKDQTEGPAEADESCLCVHLP